MMEPPARARSVSRAIFAFSALTATVALAQVYPGGYPPGGYPQGGGYPGGYPGRYPGGGGVGLPTPGKKGKPQADSTKGQPLPNFRGKLKQMDAKTITLALDDDRELQFKRTDKTKFLKGGDEIKDPKFAAGDQISVEGPYDSNGNLTAVNVYWEKSAGAATTTAEAKDGGAVDTWKDAPAKDASGKDVAGKDAPAAASIGSVVPERAPEKATQMAPPPAKNDADDPGPPVLRRGRPQEDARQHAPEPPPMPASAPPPSTVPSRPVETAGNLSTATVGLPRIDDDAPLPPSRQEDDLIRKASDTALDFTESLPNYVCQEQMTRYQSDSTPARWQALDVVSANVVYENGKEDYRNLAINGKTVNKKITEMDGSWSTGEFGTVLIDLFSPATAADFRYRGQSRAAGTMARQYDFTVTHEHSHWDIHMASQSYSPAYKGSVWIDPQTARVLRIEMEAFGFPADFPTDHVESATDYQNVRLGDARQYLLPVHSESLSCQRGSNLCSRNSIDFRNYHKYSGESTIEFNDTKK